MQPTIKSNQKAFAASAEAPPAVKIAFAVIPATCLAFGLFRSGVGAAAHAAVAPTVASAAEASGAFLYAIAAVVVVFGMAVVAASFGKK